MGTPSLSPHQTDAGVICGPTTCSWRLNLGRGSFQGQNP